MKRNVTLSIAAALLIAGASAQAENSLESTGNTIVEHGMEGAGGGSYENVYWKEEYPFPREFGRAVD
jgi:hypothetical protein